MKEKVEEIEVMKTPSGEAEGSPVDDADNVSVDSMLVQEERMDGALLARER